MERKVVDRSFLFLFFLIVNFSTIFSQRCTCTCRSSAPATCECDCGSDKDIPLDNSDSIASVDTNGEAEMTQPLTQAESDVAADSRASGTKPVIPAEPAQPFQFQSNPARSIHGNIMEDSIKLIGEKVFTITHRFEDLFQHTVEKWKEEFDFTLGEDGMGNPELDINKFLIKLFDFALKPAPMNRMSQRVAGLDPLALVGDWMAVTMSNLVVTYQVAPIWTLMEIAMTKYLCSHIGWQKTGDGVPTSGAGVANSLALNVALRNHRPEIRDNGLYKDEHTYIIYVSRHASESWKTAAIYNGVGVHSVVEVPTDGFGRMDIQLLHSSVANDAGDGRKLRVPLMIVATAGTLITGVIDPIKDIADICRKFNIWLHVDAELAGGYLFTSRNSPYIVNSLRGIERANSVTMSMWLFQAPYPNSMLLTRDPDALENSFGLHASYVFTGIDNYNMSYDKGDHTIQTSRRPEISKMWFAATRGEAGTLQMLDNQMRSKEKFYELLTNAENRVKFGVVGYTGPAAADVYSVPLMSFYFIPPSLRGKPLKETVNKISDANVNILRMVRKRGLLDISITALQHGLVPVTLTISFANTRLQSDVEYFKVVIQIIEAADYDKERLSPDWWARPMWVDKVPDVKYPNYPHLGTYQDFFKKIVDIILNSGIYFKRSDRVNNLQQPNFFETNPSNFDLNLPYSDGGNLLDKLLKQCKRIIEFSPHWAHPYFIYQLATGLDPYTVIADFVVPLLNTPMIFPADGSTPFIIMERELVKAMILRIYKRTDDAGDGIITDGGSMGNQVAIAVAKYLKQGDPFRDNGYRSTNRKKFIVYTSSDAHYSTKKGSIFQSIGQNNTIEVESNDIGQMRVDKLEAAIAKTKRDGDIPLMVVITTGTTIYGAIDPITPIIDICQRERMWSHVDGMFGGLVALSDTHIPLFKGIERSDSWGADLHKLMGSSMVCSIFITPHTGILYKTFKLPRGSGQSELNKAFQGGAEEHSLLGRHPQLDKRNNVFKFWFLWKVKGRKGLQAHVDTIMRNKNSLIAEIKKRANDGFELIIPNYDLTNICFIYIPPHLNPKKNPNVKRNTPQWIRQMDQFTFSIEKEFLRNGISSFVTQSRHLPNGQDTMKFIKFVMMGSSITLTDIKFLLDAVVYYAGQIKPSDRARTPVGPEGHSHDARFEPFGSMPMYYKVDGSVKLAK